MDINFVFRFDQMKFIDTRILDVSLHKGVCLSMCIDYIDRRKKQLPFDFIYCSNLYRFASYQRALSYGAEAGKIPDAVLFPNGRFRVPGRQYAYLFWEECPKYEFNPEQLSDGDYIINVVYSQDCHAIGLRKYPGGIEVFDPNEGLFISESANTLKLYLQDRNKNISRYIYIYRCL
jgi:hypothetical protein